MARKAEIIDLLEEARKRKRVIKSVPLPTVEQSIIGGHHNYQAGGDMNINSRKVERPVVQPGPQNIPEETAFKIYELVHKAVEIESVTGKPKDKLFQGWWSRIKKRYKVTSYKMIPFHLGDDAISYMQQEVAKLRPKIRRRDNEAWRKSLYTGIYARTRQLGRDKSWVYEVVLDRIGKKIESLTDLGERDLKKLYDVIMSF